jgi:glycosyltransferase involved in cell wall biosynthesis
MTAQQQKKKILYIITKSNWGGAQKYVYDMATNASRLFDVTVVFGGNGLLKQKLEEKNIRTASLPSLSRDINLFADVKTFFDLLSLFKKERPDIVHLNSSKIGAIGALAGRIAKVPKIIFTAHGWAFNENRSFLAKKSFRLIHWLTVLLSHQTIAVSNAVLRDMKGLAFIKNKITVVQNGVEKFFTIERATARKLLLPQSVYEAIPDDACWMGTISELHSNKGLSYGIQAMAKLRDSYPKFHFVFIIMGEGDERGLLEKMIREFHLESIVFLVGHKENAPTLLSAFDIFLLSSITEALSLSVLEAGVAGLPVVASAVGGIPEIIKDMESGILIRSKCPDEMVKALEFLIFHPAEAAGFGKKLRAKIKKDFSLARMIRETEAIYKDINLSS